MAPSRLIMPVSTTSGQQLYAPDWHSGHCMQPMPVSPVTRSPGAKPTTPSPTAATCPAHSCPGTMGYLPHPDRYASWLPLRTSMSVKQIPAKPTRTKISPGPGSGTGTSTSRRSPAAAMRTARMYVTSELGRRVTAARAGAFSESRPNAFPASRGVCASSSARDPTVRQDKTQGPSWRPHAAASRR